MARKVDKKKRIEMAKAAFEHLRDNNFQGVTMSSIARALDIKRSSLYWYFNDLNAIFETVLDNLLDEQDAFVINRLEGIRHPLDLVMAYVSAVHDFYTGREDIIIFMFQFWAIGSSSEAGRALDKLKAHHQPRRDMAIALFESGIESGLIRPCDPHVIVSIIGALIDGLLMQRIIDPSFDLQPRYDIILEQIINPLRPQ